MGAAVDDARGQPQGPGKRACGAQLRGKPGVYCRRPPLRGHTRCALHGGKTPCGPGLPQFRTGMYSRLLPAGLAHFFRRVYADREELLNAAEELALLKTRIAELLGRLRTG